MSLGGEFVVIGIDGRELEGKPTGVGSYLGNVLRNMEPGANFRMQIFFKNEIPPLDAIDAEPVLLRSGSRNLLWQNGTLARELNNRNVRLFFTPTANSISFFSGIQAITIHDLSHFQHPEWFRLRERWVRRFSARRAVRRAERIYVVSNHVRGEIIQRFGISSDKILLTPNGVEQRNPDPESRFALRKSYGYGSGKIILYVGSIFQRRHLPVVIEAMKKLGEDVKLVVIGENRTYPRMDLPSIAHKHSVTQRVSFLEYVPSKVVQDYYGMADAFVYLSTYEGFGIPPLEAMSYGVPAVISRTPAMDEVYKGCAEFAAIHPDAVAESLQRVLCDQALRENLIQAGFEKVQHSRWRDTANVIRNDWEHLIGAGS